MIISCPGTVPTSPGACLLNSIRENFSIGKHSGALCKNQLRGCVDVRIFIFRLLAESYCAQFFMVGVQTLSPLVKSNTLSRAVPGDKVYGNEGAPGTISMPSISRIAEASYVHYEAV